MILESTIKNLLETHGYYPVTNIGQDTVLLINSVYQSNDYQETKEFVLSVIITFDWQNTTYQCETLEGKF